MRYTLNYIVSAAVKFAKQPNSDVLDARKMERNLIKLKCINKIRAIDFILRFPVALYSFGEGKMFGISNTNFIQEFWLKKCFVILFNKIIYQAQINWSFQEAFIKKHWYKSTNFPTKRKTKSFSFPKQRYPIKVITLPRFHFYSAKPCLLRYLRKRDDVSSSRQFEGGTCRVPLMWPPLSQSHQLDSAASSQKLHTIPIYRKLQSESTRKVYCFRAEGDEV